MQQAVPCMIIRGGTSKGLYFLDRDLPPPGAGRDKTLLRLMGSPDIRQIDGLGGAVSVTSKAAILAPSSREGIDVDYTFAQVSVDKPMVSYTGNCGNISSGVGPFAIESGLVKAGASATRVRIFNTNTQKIMVEEVETPGGRVNYAGNFEIPGVPGGAAPVKVVVQDPGGAVCGSLLPTGSPVDELALPGFGPLPVSIVDAANPLVFVLAADIGMSGKEGPEEIDANPPLLALLETIRGEAAKRLGFVEQAEESAWKSPTVPKMTIVAPPAEYTSASGEIIQAERADLLGRMMSMQRPHPTYALTGAMCTAAAAAIPGTLVHRVRRPGADTRRLRIAHPGGILEAGADHENSSQGIRILNVYGFRTARLLMKGTAFC
ncbi:MAG: 3-methylitaconate isomerase [Treponema sp.]|nr:3-methylitaconate isomerase [Treponema sp.]